MASAPHLHALHRHLEFADRRSSQRRRRPGGGSGRPDAAAGIDLANLLAGTAHRPVVYFVLCGDRIKIGTTTNLKKRMAALSLALDWVVFVSPGDKDLEAEYHRAFGAERIRSDREWFWCKGKLRRFLAPVLPPQEPWIQRFRARILPAEYASSREAQQAQQAESETYDVVGEPETQPSVELLGGPELLSLAEIARRLTADGVTVNPALLRAHKRRHAGFPRPARTARGRDWYAYDDVRAYYTARAGSPDEDRAAT